MVEPKVALITGITGQDGSYLAELLLKKGYAVHGVIRRSSSFNTRRIEDLYEDPHVDTRMLYLHYGDLTDSTNCFEIVSSVRPDELYNLGAQSHVKVSFEMSEYTADTDGLGTLRLLNAIRSSGLAGKTRFYQASTSELYGLVQEVRRRRQAADCRPLSTAVLPPPPNALLRPSTSPAASAASATSATSPLPPRPPASHLAGVWTNELCPALKREAMHLATGAPARDDALLPALAVRRGQAVRVLDRGAPGRRLRGWLPSPRPSRASLCRPRRSTTARRTGCTRATAR